MKKYAFVIDGIVVRIKNSADVPTLIPDERGLWIDATNTTAVLGSTYNKIKNIFVPPKMYESWVYDPVINSWVPPTPAPDNGVLNHWDEPSKSWKIT